MSLPGGRDLYNLFGGDIGGQGTVKRAGITSY
jgi:hypothetical protein